MKIGNRNNSFTAFAKRMIGVSILAMTILGVSAACTRRADAQEGWVERAKIVAQLSTSHGETPVALGITPEGWIIELFRAKDGASWSLVVTLPNGLSRLVTSGEAWIAIPQQVGGHLS